MCMLLCNIPFHGSHLPPRVKYVHRMARRSHEFRPRMPVCVDSLHLLTNKQTLQAPNRKASEHLDPVGSTVIDKWPTDNDGIRTLDFQSFVAKSILKKLLQECSITNIQNSISENRTGFPWFSSAPSGKCRGKTSTRPCLLPSKFFTVLTSSNNKKWSGK